MGRKKEIQIANMVGKPISEKMDQLEIMVRKDGEQTRQNHKEQIGEIKKIIDVFSADLSSREKKELYDLNVLIDISTLEETEKQFLIEVLYTLAGMVEQITETQQAFIRSVQKYLDVKNVQTTVNLTSIENINSILTQKALLQTIMEFLFLENNCHDNYNEYQDLFSYFSVNSKSIEDIKSKISNIYTSVGSQGLIEKYGYVEETVIPSIDPILEEILNVYNTVGERGLTERYGSLYQTNYVPISSTYDEIFLTESIEIEEGTEKVFTNAIIHLNCNIECRGSLRFDNCQLSSDTKLEHQFIYAEDANIVFNNCSLNFEDSYDCNSSYFENMYGNITIFGRFASGGLLYSRNSRISFIQCTIHKGRGLVKGDNGSLIFDSCHSDDLNPHFINSIGLSKFEITNCNFTVEKHDSYISNKLYDMFNRKTAAFDVRAENFIVSGSTFSGFTDGVFEGSGSSGIASIKNSKFISCTDVICGQQKAHFEQCDFNQCIHLFKQFGYQNQINLTNCHFYECIGEIKVNELIMERCTFKNGIPNINVTSYKDKSGHSSISNCIFEDWDLSLMTNKLMIASQNNDSYFKFTTDNEITTLLTQSITSLIHLGNKGKLTACRFENINIVPLRFLMSCTSDGSVSMSNCVALNCKTTESILDKTVYHSVSLNPFKKDEYFKPSYRMNNSTGFDL